MLTQTEQITIEQTVAAGHADVFYALTNSFAVRDWLCADALLNPQAGGRFYVGWADGYYEAGSYGEVVADQSFSVALRGPAEAEFGQLRVTLAEQDGATQVTLSYTPAEGASEAATGQVDRRWREGLENLASLVASGIDLRQARRPMIGISGLQDLNPALVARLGVPVSAGVRIAGTVEGMSAALAGLQKDDVLVAVDTTATPTTAELAQTLGDHTAGDTVEITFYRGDERLTRTMTLQKRVMPATPTTAAELAAVAQGFYDVQTGEITKLLTDASEAQANWRPAPGEWNAKDVLAHLIATEQDSQVWIMCINDGLDYTQPFHSNMPARIAAISAAYPTAAAILDEFTRTSHVTLLMLENLPDNIARRRNNITFLSGWWGSGLPHANEHIAEVARLLEGARAAGV